MIKREDPKERRALDALPTDADGSSAADTAPPPPPSRENTGQLALTDLEMVPEPEISAVDLSEDDLMSSDSIPRISTEDIVVSTPPTPPPAGRAAAKTVPPATPATPAMSDLPQGLPQIDYPGGDVQPAGASQPAGIEPGAHGGAGASEGDLAEIDWGEEHEFLARERDACATAQPQRGALMSLAAATAAEQSGDATEELLQRALGLAGDDPAMVPLVRDLMMLQRNYQAALQLTEDEQRLGGEVSTRVASLLDAAAIVHYKHGDGERALRLARQALDLQSGHPVALTFVSTSVVELHHDRQAAKTFEQLADIIRAPEERAALFFAAGTTHEFLLGEDDKAAQSYRHAIDADPLHVPALLALQQLLERTGDWSALSSTLEQLAEAPLAEVDKAYYLMRAGVIRLARLEDNEGAARCLESASALVPSDPWCLSRLAHVHESTSQHDALVSVLRRRLELTADNHGKASLLTRIGWVLQSRLADEEGAVAAYRQALAARPGYPPAVRALQRLYRRRGEFESLLEILHQEAEGSAPATQRALVCLEAAELLLAALKRPDDAQAFFQRAIELDPELSLAFWPLRRLLDERGQHRELAQLIEQQLGRLQDAPTRGHLLLELARLQAGPLAKPALAIDTLKAAAEAGTGPSATIELVDLYARLGREGDLSALLLGQADQAAQPAEQIRLRLEAARMLERQGDHERAAEVYTQVAEQDPRNHLARWALSDLHNRLGRWSELQRLLRQQAKDETRQLAAAELWCAVGRIEEDQLGRRDEAIAAYRKALSLDPQLGQALGALERLLLSEGKAEDLIAVLIEHATSCKEAVAAADALCRAAELADHHLHDLQRAEDLYRQALERHGGSGLSLKDLFAAQCRNEAYGPAAETLERLIAAVTDPQSRGLLQLQLLRLREYRLNQQPTLDELRDATGHTSFGDKLALEQLRVARLSLSTDQLAPLLSTLGAAARDDGLGAGLLLEAAYRYELGDDATGFVDAAEQASRRAGAGDVATAASLRRAYQREGRYAELASALEETSSSLEPHLQPQRLHHAAANYLRAGLRAEATRAITRCLEIDPHNVPALRLRATIASCNGDWPALARSLDKLAELCASVDNRLRSSLQAADLWTHRIGDRQRALGSLMAALRDDPDDEQAYALAQRLFEELDRHGELAQLQAYRIDRTRDQARQVTLLREHAALLRDRLANPTAAVHILARLLTASPGDVQALQDSVALLIQLRRWTDAAGALEALAQSTSDPAVVRDARLRRAQVCFEQLHEPQQARESLYDALELDPTDAEAKRLLVRVDLAEGKWEEARQTLETLAAEGDSRQGVWAMSRLADVARTGFGDDALRERWEREALIQAATDAEALSELTQHYRERKETAGLVNLVQSVLRETTDAAVAASLRLTLAGLLVEDLHQPDAALEQLRECLVADPDNLTANLLHAQALEQKEEFEQALGSYRRLLSQDPDCTQAYRGVLRLTPRLGATAIAGAAAAAIDLLGAATSAERAQIDTLESAGMPPGALEPLPIEGDEMLGEVREVLELAAPHMGGLYQLKLAKEVASSDPVRAAAAQLARAVGLPGVKVSVEGTVPALAGAGQTVPVQVSPELATAPDKAPFRFWVGRALASATTAGALIQCLSDAQLGELIEALCNDHPIDPTIQQLHKRVFRALPRKIRKQVAQFAYPQLASDIWDRYRAAETARADRMGLVLSGSPRTALFELAKSEGVEGAPSKSERLSNLVRFSISEDYARSHAALWTSSAG